MNNPKFILSILLAVLFSLNSCSGNSHKQKIVVNSNDTSKVKVQLSKFGEKDFGYKDVNHLSQILKLDPLQKGFDSIQIRIWYPYSVGRNVIVIRKQNQNWQGFLYTINYENNIAGDSTGKVENYSEKEIFPKTNWEELMKTIFSLGITSLPDVNEIPEYDGGGIDGFSYDFEIATTQYYRYYSYWMPYSYSNKLWQAKKIVEIIKFINQEFDLSHVINIEET